jgi:hypothetical protein
MNTLPKDIIRLLVFNYVDGEYARNFLKICSKVYYSFSKTERKLLRMKSLYFIEKIKQEKYIKKVIDDMTIKGIEENVQRVVRGVKPKKYNYFFCEGCANVIRPGIVRGVRHENNCKKNFNNCKWCGIPYASQYSPRGSVSSHAYYLLHNECKCPRRNNSFYHLRF